MIKDIQQSQGLIQDRLDTSTERLVRREKEGRREEECVCVCVCVCVCTRWSISVTGVQPLLLQSAARELTACPPPISTSSDITRAAGHAPRGSVYTEAVNNAAGQSWPSARHLPH